MELSLREMILIGLVLLAIGYQVGREATYYNEVKSVYISGYLAGQEDCTLGSTMVGLPRIPRTAVARLFVLERSRSAEEILK